ncbi:MAG: serine hydrolase [Sphingomonas bacterium]|uniref:serine hydrolase n=1 Tax=Sphingomonas bacterium TaxID=1895847 RepID=UPI0026142CEE|nr:serine hydrolase [Sphingomonas bacterium]MDB5697153.1 serine hydrolase [Sphingomonas bacterium]
MDWYGAIAGLLTVAMAGCGSPERPGYTARAAMLTPPVIVSVPVPIAQPRAARPAPVSLVEVLVRLQRGFAGRAGVAVSAVDEGWTAEAGGRQYLPQQSVSKLWVALTVLNLRDQGRLRLDDPVTVTADDLTVFNQPIAALARKPGGFQTSVGDLLTRALTRSDNTANDKLMWLAGGPVAVRATIEAKQLGAIRFGPGERLLQAQTAGLTWQSAFSRGNSFEIARSRLAPEQRRRALDAYVASPPDGAQPIAIADALARLARGELLSETSTHVALTTMGQTITGRSRLRAAIPAGWQIAHKTGTGQDLAGRNAGFNDVGLLTAPDGRRYAIAVMIGETTRPVRERQQLIQSVAAAVANYASMTGGG